MTLDKAPFQNLLASVDRRRTPREPRGTPLPVDIEQPQSGGLETWSPPPCRWAARGMACDCLQCVREKARAQ